MLAHSKAHASGALVALASTLDLKPAGDYIAQGLSYEMSQTVFGAFGPDMLVWTSTIVVALGSGLIGWLVVWLVPNQPAT